MFNDTSSVQGEDSDDDFDWEEVTVPEAVPQAATSDGVPQDLPQPVTDISGYDAEESISTKPNIEITIKTQRKAGSSAKAEKSMKAVQMHAERMTRLDCHKVHTVTLLGNARIRNKWINDPLLHARLMSLTPLPLQNAFANITKARIPEAVMRGRQFEAAITRLAEWWSQTFEIEPTGHIRSRTFADVQKMVTIDPKGKGKARAVDVDDAPDDAEVIRSEKSLMKHALQRRGSRDVSAQLFTALCRALGVPARLVVSLQSVPWQASVGKPKSPTKKTKMSRDIGKSKGKGKGKAKATESDMEEEGTNSDDNDDMEEVDISPSSADKGKARATAEFPGAGQRLDGSGSGSSAKVSGKQKAPPVIKLRKSKGSRLGTASSHPRRERTPDPENTPPVFWTEVFSRPDARWLPVDPIRCIVNKRLVFDPTPNPNASNKPDRRHPVRVDNRMVYVLAFEEDGYARDVTPRYAREYGAKVAKLQQGGKGRKEWWERILALVKRPYRLQRDDLEDEEMQNKQLIEGMPTSMAGFKDHPLYVLSRHLKREEVVHPLEELGKFRGEPVYPRSNVHLLKTAENWMRQGRRIREGSQPMKFVKQRAMTINRKREVEIALAGQNDRSTPDEGGSSGVGDDQGVMQGMYAEHQTELYIPDPIVDGRIPKNDFGNIDLYTPSMLPEGAVHVPFRGTAKIARQLGFDFAEAVTGFEFKKQRAFPIITGVVVAKENEAALTEAFWEAERHAEDKRSAKRREQVIKRWTKLVQGLRIRERLHQQYANKDGPSERESSAMEVDGDEPIQPAGGFLTGADDVVQPYTLPRNFHPVLKASTTLSMGTYGISHNASPAIDVAAEEEREDDLPILPLDTNLTDDGGEASDDEMEEIIPQSFPDTRTIVPKTMRELAEDAARQQQGVNKEALDNSLTTLLEPAANTNGQNAIADTGVTRTGSTPSLANLTLKIKLPKPGKRTRTGTSEESEENTAASKRSPPKRARVAAAPVPTSDRVLRTRAPKTTTKVQEEREMEAAFRRATRE